MYSKTPFLVRSMRITLVVYGTVYIFQDNQ